MERSGMSSPTSCVLSTNRNDLIKLIYEITQHPAIEYALCYAHVPRIHRNLNHTDGSALVCASALSGTGIGVVFGGSLGFIQSPSLFSNLTFKFL